MFSGEQGALAIDVNTAAFKYHVDGLNFSVAKGIEFMQVACNLIVEIGVVFFAPAIETEIKQYGFSIRMTVIGP